MSSPASVTTTGSRVIDIAKKIYAASTPIGFADAAVASAKTALEDAGEEKVAGRITILTELGKLSSAEQWTAAEINEARTQVVGMANESNKKALQVFASEVAAAVHPDVRDHVADLYRLCDEAWQAEAEDKKGPQPCRKAFARRYHMLTQAFVLAKNGRLLHGHSDVIFWANQNDPDLDPKKVAKALADISKKISVMMANFPVSHFASINEFISEITEDALTAARDEQLAKQADLTDSHSLAPVAVAPVPTVVTPVAEEVEEVEEETEVEADPISDYLAELAA